MDVNRTVLAGGGGEKPIEQPRARGTRETLFEPAGNARRGAALPLSPGATAPRSMSDAHRTDSDLAVGRSLRSSSLASVTGATVDVLALGAKASAGSPAFRAWGHLNG